MRRVLITGGSSYLGQHLVPLALENAVVVYTYFSHDPLSLPEGRWLDVRDRSAVLALVDAVRPEIIIHTAGSNRPAETMDAVIRQGARHIADAARTYSSRLIHLSTDVVFDGREAPYTESAAAAPLHDYGKAKAAAEEIVASCPDHVIVRTSLIYGLTKIDRGTEWIASNLRAGRPVTLFTDQIRNPVWVFSLSRALLELAESEYTGIINVAGAQRLSRAELGVRLLDWWQIDRRDTLSFGPGDSERWPADCTLDISRAQSLLRTPLPGLDEVLSHINETSPRL